ncbi:fumarylacetoacetate hydrolase family protein [Streptomyces anulatus]|uniref:fumarylacetoacetate hydrolase family protein n=1 Tax=Streptomyces anulatus TaxID=1892 RepID=UPI0036D7CC7E
MRVAYGPVGRQNRSSRHGYKGDTEHRTVKSVTAGQSGAVSEEAATSAGKRHIPRRHRADKRLGRSRRARPRQRPPGISEACKSKDFTDSNVLSPWIVTADEFGAPYRLTMTARTNGEESSRGTSADMHHTFADMIAFASSSTRLHAGEVLCSGTVPTGCGLEHGRFPELGDTMELEVSGLSVLRNQVVS